MNSTCINDILYSDMKLIIYSYGTDESQSNILYQSCIDLNLDCFIDGIGTEWNGFQDQYYGFQKFLDYIVESEYVKDINNIDNDLLIMVVDAYDIFFVCNEQEIINKYLSFGSDIVISSEKYCWPDEHIYESYPESNTNYRWDFKYLNSGMLLY